MQTNSYCHAKQNVYVYRYAILSQTVSHRNEGNSVLTKYALGKEAYTFVNNHFPRRYSGLMFHCKCVLFLQSL